MSATQPTELKTICVFCGSRPGTHPAYIADAKALGALMVAEGIGLVYGGGNMGLMGTVARAVHEAGGKVLGFMPRALTGVEGMAAIGEITVVNDMHTRKRLMAAHSSAFIALPGGYGTFEELFEVITWLQLGIHGKPVGVVNTNGYYDPLVAMISGAVREGFVGERARGLVVVGDTVGEVLKALRGTLFGGRRVLRVWWEMTDLFVGDAEFKIPEGATYPLDWTVPDAEHKEDLI
ncbi:lysine decarboxylase-like protein [Fimicolochytrium jonesii]|uniref:lysine decarboxylase-like protein n=1 Tax=Fimicolochytrium jonesii TaxID=1396493 RepID=UPI0022FE26B3|nr:lysine decarboxylase-like protein [Fimicolochytrium jonesii]KAI8821774.1 lysine decarboxylase-like protein [Fimicolochytrium jonesii]